MSTLDSENDEDCLSLVYDLTSISSSVLALQTALSVKDGFKHAFAVKAAPYGKLLEMMVERGLGLECASWSEVELALSAGCTPSRIVYDSPCKTTIELSKALKLGIHLNFDNFDEIERVSHLLTKITTTSYLGIRINPLLGFGKIEALSVSNEKSKFGVPLTAENEEKLLELFTRHAWLNGLHVHVGSQGCGLEMLAQGAKIISEFAARIDAHLGEKRIAVIDVGGGLPSPYGTSDIASDANFDAYAKVLRRIAPLLFANPKQIIVTEYGRAIVAKTGFVLSKVEYVKHTPTSKRGIIVQHAGSDIFTRTCYARDSFPLRCNFYASERGDPKYAVQRDQIIDVVGPLCFGGDTLIIGSSAPMAIKVGDFAWFPDCGANCLSLWSRHCSRQAPRVVGYSRSRVSDVISLEVLKEKESVEDIKRFWS